MAFNHSGLQSVSQLLTNGTEETSLVFKIRVLILGYMYPLFRLVWAMRVSSELTVKTAQRADKLRSH